MKDYLEMRLFEISEEKIAVFTFGRFNPPTLGHEKLIDTGRELAAKKHADYFVFPSRVQDKKRNPLPFEAKVKYMKAFFPGVNIVTDAKFGKTKIRTPFESLGWLEEQGYTEIYMVTGSDRAEEFKQRMGDYMKELNPSATLDTAYGFKKFDVVSAGPRDPDAEGVVGISASKVRELARDNDKENFLAAMPSKGSKKLKLELFKELRKGIL